MSTQPEQDLAHRVAQEEHKMIVRRLFEEVWNEGRLDVLDKIAAADYINHPQAHQPNFGGGVEGEKQFISMYRSAFPDVQMTIEDMLAEGDKVVVRWTGRGTHNGELMGIPPTGKQATVTGIAILRITDGKLAEGWGEFDALGMMQQLGVIPAPEQA